MLCASTKAEVSGALKESSDVLNQFDEVAAHLDIDSWNAPEAFRGRQRLLLTEAQEGLSDVRDDTETELESVSSGKHASTQDLLSVCTKMSQLAHFIENVSVYYSAFQTDAVYSEAVNLSELAGSAKMASIHCGGILSVGYGKTPCAHVGRLTNNPVAKINSSEQFISPRNPVVGLFEVFVVTLAPVGEKEPMTRMP